MTKQSVELPVTTRRAFMAQMAIGTSAFGLKGSFASLPVSFAMTDWRVGPPVLSFHMDRPYLDMNGMAAPYLPPQGAMGAAAVAELDEFTFRMRHPYL